MKQNASIHQLLKHKPCGVTDKNLVYVDKETTI